MVGGWKQSNWIFASKMKRFNRITDTQNRLNQQRTRKHLKRKRLSNSRKESKTILNGWRFYNVFLTLIRLNSRCSKYEEVKEEVAQQIML